mmetsp:Transcript_125139/g.399995  ORF Transcript_125139/g.399995 Transcript_125139/m.399995 type:complete len:245 (-) Transcript_125139:434-1168(-)
MPSAKGRVLAHEDKCLLRPGQRVQGPRIEGRQQRGRDEALRELQHLRPRLDAAPQHLERSRRRQRSIGRHGGPQEGIGQHHGGRGRCIRELPPELRAVLLARGDEIHLGVRQLGATLDQHRCAPLHRKVRHRHLSHHALNGTAAIGRGSGGGAQAKLEGHRVELTGRGSQHHGDGLHPLLQRPEAPGSQADVVRERCRGVEMPPLRRQARLRRRKPRPQVAQPVENGLEVAVQNPRNLRRSRRL